uniref:uncharacterized protein LOC122601110 n=1 Tax=Erigeron canadensis TaxID=72917 RepID=UPI001CB8CAE6|nr:uncharacterized protein LOC122601110 [Erigeron canadensis]
MANVNGETPMNETVDDFLGDVNVFGTQISKLNFGDELYLHASDTSGTPLINFKLKGTENYKVWVCAMELALETKNKIGFITGTCVKYVDNDVLSRQWDICNFVVLSWILNSVTEELYLGQIFTKNAKVVWEELKETYDKVDGSITFNLHHRIHSLKQNGKPISEYYHNLNSLWKQFDALVKLPTCSCNAAKEIYDHQQLLKLMQFLMGLDDVYQPVRSNIMLKGPLPKIKTAFAIISREESHRGVNTSDNHSKPHNTVFFLAKTFESGKKNLGPNTSLQCSGCLKYGHTLDRCFEVVGYPPGYGRNTYARINPSQSSFKSSHNAMVNNNSIGSIIASSSGFGCSSIFGSNSGSNITLTPDRYAKLINLLTDKPPSKSVHANMAGLTVGHPNGTQARVLKIGDLRLENNIILFGVLLPSFVLSGKFPYELIYRSKPNLSHLRSFGCLCFSTILNNDDKFSSRSEKCILIGYSNEKKGYKLFSLDNKTVFFSRDVKFYEGIFPLKMVKESLGNKTFDQNKTTLKPLDSVFLDNEQLALSPLMSNDERESN